MALQVPDVLDTKTYSFQRVRHMLADTPLQQGAAGGLSAAPRAASANMTVDIAAGSGWVLGTRVARQGLYHIVDVGGANVPIAAAHPTLPRLDQVFVRVEDSTAGDTADQATYYVAAGTPTAGATLDNRAGAITDANLPYSVMRIADILVPAGTASIVAALIRDRRAWARGALYQAPLSGQNISCGPVGNVLAQARIEASGAPLRIVVNGANCINYTGQIIVPAHGIRVNGAVLAKQAATGNGGGISVNASSPMGGLDTIYTPAAGSNVFAWTNEWADPGGGAYQASPFRPSFYVEEIIRANASNGAV